MDTVTYVCAHCGAFSSPKDPCCEKCGCPDLEERVSLHIQPKTAVEEIEVKVEV